MGGEGEEITPVGLHHVQLFFSPLLTDKEDASGKRPFGAAEDLENLIGKGVRHLSFIARAAAIAAAIKEAPGGDVIKAGIKDQLIAADAVGTFDQSIDRQNAPLREIDVGA